MNINYKPAQIELFPSNGAESADLSKPRFFFANLTLSVESLVILSILGIMVTLFSFAIGVEQGKRMVAQSLDERVAQAWNVDARRNHPVASAVKTVVIPQAAVVTAQPAKSVVALKPVTKASVVKPAVVAKTTVVAKATPVAKVAATASVTRLTYQLATYRSEKYARDEAMALRGKGIQTFLVKSGAFWLVCSGQFTNKEDATAFLGKLPAKYRKAQLRRF